MNSFFDDEISKLVSFLKDNGLYNSLCETEICVLGDDFGLGKYVAAINEGLAEAEIKNKACVYIIDFTKENPTDTEPIFENTDKNTQFIFIPVFTFEKPLPQPITALSERELTALADCDTDFRSAVKMTAFENSLKKYVTEHNIKVIRYTNVFGPAIESSGVIENILSDFKENNQINISKKDYQCYVSVSYIDSVLKDLFSVIFCGKNGNIYNGSNISLTLSDVKNSIYKSFCDKGSQISFSENSENINGYMCLACHKIKAISKNADFILDEALFKTLVDDESRYIERFVKDHYDGKIGRIREEEIEILSEVDRICKEKGINYYLVGGSLLGAVRNGGFIPWDDDVDICMLREDFEKFRRICPKELNEKYAYQSYRDEKSTHYIYDKIRLKGTYFSSEHSNKYDDMENGIFLDVFVFDKTANSKLLQRLHVYLIVMLRRLIHIRWIKEPVTGKFAFISKLILPLVCLLPFGFYHTLFERILRFFEKSKKSRFVLDGIGLYIKKGALPLRWVTDYKNVDFEGLSLPGVTGNKEYLSMWYGENYMTPPVLSKRTSGHKISRLDLGEYLFKNNSHKDISLKGELFDK